MLIFTEMKIHDKNGEPVHNGDILQLDTTVNGEDRFVVSSPQMFAAFESQVVDIPDEQRDFTKHVKLRYQRTRKPYEYSYEDFFARCPISGEVSFEIVGNIYTLAR